MLEGLPTCMSGIDSAKFGLSKGAPILGQETLMSAYSGLHTFAVGAMENLHGSLSM